MRLIDTHCHLYVDEFKPDLNDTIARAKQNGVEKIFLPATDSDTDRQLLELAETSDCCLAMMGLHPCCVKENFESELKAAENYLNSGKKFYAVGEIGLDYYWDLSFKEQQIFVFEKQIEWSIEKNLPVAIHSRNSTADCIKSVSKFTGKAKGIFHCFSGTLEEAKQIIALGFFLGIGGVVTYKNTNLREILKVAGLDNVVLETDAPYLTPVPHRGKRNEPSYLKIICEATANAVGKSFEEAAAITTANAEKVFRLNT